MKNTLLLFFVVCFLFFSQNTYADEILDSEKNVVVYTSEEENGAEDLEPVTIKEMKENLE
jgi:hypothetical protein